MDQMRQDANIMDGKVQNLRVRLHGYEQDIATWQRWIEGLELQKAEQRRKGGTGGMADAQQMDASPEGIKKRIEELRVFYTDDHPDIQRLLRTSKRPRPCKRSRTPGKRRRPRPRARAWWASRPSATRWTKSWPRAR